MVAWLLWSHSREGWIDGDGYTDIPCNADRFSEAVANVFAAADPDLRVECMVDDRRRWSEADIARHNTSRMGRRLRGHY